MQVAKSLGRERGDPLQRWKTVREAAGIASAVPDAQGRKNRGGREWRRAAMGRAGCPVNSLWRIANACTGLRARVDYSRLFTDQAGQQIGRLNKSPHTVHAFANSSKRCGAGDK